MPDELKNKHVYTNKDTNVKFNRLSDLYGNDALTKKFEDLRLLFEKGDKNRDGFYPYTWDDPNRGTAESKGIPYVPRPSMFQPDPFVVTSFPREAVLAKRILDLDPGTKRRTRQITFGPTSDTMNWQMHHGNNIEEFAGTDLVGTAGRQSGQIGINPKGEIGDSNPLYDYAEVLAHETGHRSGYGENTAEVIGEQLRRVFGRQN